MLSWGRSPRGRQAATARLSRPARPSISARRQPVRDPVRAWRELALPAPGLRLASSSCPPAFSPPPQPHSFLESSCQGTCRGPGDPRPPPSPRLPGTRRLLLFFVCFSLSFFISFFFCQRVTLFGEPRRCDCSESPAPPPEPARCRSRRRRTMRVGTAGGRAAGSRGPTGPRPWRRTAERPRHRGGGGGGSCRAAGSINRKVLPFSPGRILLKAGLGGRHLPAIFFPLLLFASLPPPGAGGVGRAGVCVCVGWRE